MQAAMKSVLLASIGCAVALAASGCAPAVPSAPTSKPAATNAVMLDTAVGTNGIAALSLSATTHDRFLAVASGADGKIYAAGFTTLDGDQAFAVARIDGA